MIINQFTRRQKKKSLLNKVPRVSKCLSAQVPFECPTAPVPECPSSKCLECPSAKVPFERFFECPVSAQYPLECSLSKKVWNITRNGLVNNFIEFLKTFQNIYFCITLIVFSFLGNKIYNFYYILLARCNHSRGFQKLSLNILQSLRKPNMIESGALFLVKL